MAEAGGFPDRIRHVPHFVDCAGITAKEDPGGPVVFAGRLSPEKGVDTLIEAAGILGSPVEIAGDGPERERLTALAARRAPGLVRFHGRLDKAEVLALFRAASVVAVPSRWFENQPMTVLEAFACGVPVVASDLGGLSELIDPGVDGDLVPPNDAEALAAALERLTTRPAAALALGQAARAKAEHDFSCSRHLQRLSLRHSASGRTWDDRPAGRAGHLRRRRAPRRGARCPPGGPGPSRQGVLPVQLRCGPSLDVPGHGAAPPAHPVLQALRCHHP